MAKQTFEEYLQEVINHFPTVVPDMTLETAKAHVEGMTDFYKDCYNDDLSAPDAIAEDVAEWEDHGEEED